MAAEKVILAHRPDCDASAVAQLLERHGYEMRSVHDGEGLIALADSWQPDAAVIELGLEGRPALAAGSALRIRFGGEIRLVGLTIPSAPELEKHALDAGFDHVVVDLRRASEVLLALSAQGAVLVRRGRGASFAFASTMIDHARLCLAMHHELRAASARHRNIAMLRRTIESIATCAGGDTMDARQNAHVKLALSELEAQFERLVRPQDGQG